MSEALERVIAEQQREIDRLRLMAQHGIEARQCENAAVEKLVANVFGVLNHPDSTDYRYELKLAVMSMGFCPTCECRSCECEGQYD